MNGWCALVLWRVQPDDDGASGTAAGRRPESLRTGLFRSAGGIRDDQPLPILTFLPSVLHYTTSDDQ